VKIVVGMSGGVDSAVAALLLKQQGHEVVGVYMHNWEDDDPDGVCTSLQDAKSAIAVCAHLGIPLETVNFSREYWERVFDHFLAEHRAGRTPNPDVLCNKEIKFKAFLAYARGLGAEHIATGHYARLDHASEAPRLLRAADGNKDQTYFLYAVPTDALARTLFPLGHLRKPQVRAIARAAGLPNHDRSDSTGICFVGERNYKAFVARYLPARPGEIRTVDGDSKGRHDGLMYYTVGQRHGLGLGGPGGAWYVVDKDTRTNVLFVAQGARHEALYRDGLVADDVHWIRPPPAGADLTAKTRYRQIDQPCRIEPLVHGRVRVRFAEPQRALTPGQAVVFYHREECLGGARIVAVEASSPATPSLAATC
jgi:tRNA-uridine 2-sulfurtransferase